MKVILCLTDKISEELHDADDYIELAIKWKEDNPDASDLFEKLSEEELVHMERLHSEVVEQIKAYREERGDPPKGMIELYEHLHRKHMEEAMKIRIKQNYLRS